MKISGELMNKKSIIIVIVVGVVLLLSFGMLVLNNRPKSVETAEATPTQPNVEKINPHSTIEINEKKFEGYLVAVYDPSRIKLYNSPKLKSGVCRGCKASGVESGGCSG